MCEPETPSERGEAGRVVGDFGPLSFWSYMRRVVIKCLWGLFGIFWMFLFIMDKITYAFDQDLYRLKHGHGWPIADRKATQAW